MKFNFDEVISSGLRSFRDELEQELEMVGSSKTYRNDGYETLYYDPYVPVHLSRYVYHNCSILSNVVECLSQDILLNDYSLSDPEEDNRLVDRTWNDVSQTYQLYLAGVEYFIYGYSALEVIHNGNRITFKQIPAHTLRIRVVHEESPSNGRDYLFYYAEQEVNGQQLLLRLSNYDYSLLDRWGISHNVDGECIWIGGCNENDFFDIPNWTRCRKSIYTSLMIDELNERKISCGNVPAGVMMFTGPPERPDPNDPDDMRIADKLERDLNDGSGGTVFSYLENPSSKRDITMQYQALSDNNYEYLEVLQESCMDNVARAYKIPKIRLMVDDVKESMNSNKSDSIYEIYNREIAANQLFYQQIIDDFNRKYLHVHSEVVISTPEFTDKTNTRISTIVELFNNALLTLGECVELLTPIYPGLDFEELDEYWFDKRFYQGQVLGTNNEAPETVEALDSVIGRLDKRVIDEDKDIHETVDVDEAVTEEK